MRLFRKALLERLVSRHAISEQLEAKLLAWRHPGFSTHVGEPIPPHDSRAIEDMASYVYYANRARGARAKEKKLREVGTAEAPKKRPCSPTWARSIAKVYHADPFTCRKCGGPMKIVAYIRDHFTVKKILDHLGLSPPEIERPPPGLRYVPLDHEGRVLDTMVADGPHST